MYCSCEASAFAYGGCFAEFSREIGKRKHFAMVSSVQPSCAINCVSAAEVGIGTICTPSSRIIVPLVLNLVASAWSRAADTGSSFVGAIRAKGDRPPLLKNAVLLDWIA